jgi:hypothetical protein
MTTKAMTTKGTQLKIGNGATPTEVFTTIAEVLNVSGPAETVGTIDCTSMDSTGKEYISTALPDVGEVTFECHFIGNNAQQQQLRADLRSGVRRNFELDMPDTTKVQFAALVTNLGPEMPAEGKITQKVTVKPTGLPVWTYAP